MVNNIKLLREQKGLSQCDIAVALMVSPQAVSKWERGESAPKWEQAPKLADLLDCTIDALYGRDKPGSQAS